VSPKIISGEIRTTFPISTVKIGIVLSICLVVGWYRACSRIYSFEKWPHGIPGTVFMRRTHQILKSNSIIEAIKRSPGRQRLKSMHELYRKGKGLYSQVCTISGACVRRQSCCLVCRRCLSWEKGAAVSMRIRANALILKTNINSQRILPFI